MTITLLYGGLLGLLFLTLTVLVIARRFKYRVSIGEGNCPELQTAIRAHGNFAEYVPLCLVLLGGCELAGVAPLWLHISGVLLVIGRILHAIGIQIPKAPNPYRMFGILSTFAVLLMLSLLALSHALV